MNIPQRVYDGSDVELSRIYLRSASGAASVPAVRFFSPKGLQVNGGVGSTSISLSLDTAWRSLASLWEAAAQAVDSSAAWQAKVDDKGAAACISDGVSAEVWVSLGDPSPAVPSIKLASGSQLRIGPLPAETEGSSSSLQGQVEAVLVDLQRAEGSLNAMGHKGLMPLAVRKDVPGSLVVDDGAYAPVQVTRLGRVRTTSAIETGASSSSTLNAAGDLLAIDCLGMGSACCWLTSLSGSSVNIAFEVTYDGTNWLSARFHVMGIGVSSASTVSTVAAVNQPRVIEIPYGAVQVRARMTSGSAGPHTVNLTANATPYAEKPNVVSGGTVVQGLTAHDSVLPSSFYPVTAGGAARSSDPAAVSQGDAAALLVSLLGKAVFLPYALPGSSWFYAAASGGITSASSTTLAAPAGAGVRSCLRSLQASNQSATAVTVTIRDGSGGTVLWRARLDGDAGAAGFSASFEPPLRGSANTALVLETDAAGEVYANAQGFTSAE